MADLVHSSPPPPIDRPVISRVSADDQLIAMWLHGRPRSTAESYRKDIEQFQKFIGYVPLRSIVLEDLQAYQDYLTGRSLKPKSIQRKLNSLKSLFTYATKLGYTPFNIAVALRLPKSTGALAQRILKPIEVLRLIDREPNPRNKAFFKLMYAIGGRVSEICPLTWRDFQEQPNGDIQVTILGKGGKLRTVLVPLSVWMELEALRGDAKLDDPVFKNARGKALDRTRAHRLIKEAAARIGLENVSCHWLRHAHAQHSLAKGAPINLVRDTLGHSSIAVTNVYLEAMPNDSSSKYLGL